MTKAYYWLKLQKKFFSSYEIKIIKKQQNGAEYIVFWLQLLLEGVEAIERAEFMLNNNYTSRYARLLMANEPELAGMFETRTLKS